MCSRASDGARLGGLIRAPWYSSDREEGSFVVYCSGSRPFAGVGAVTINLRPPTRLGESWRSVRNAALATPGLRVVLLAIRNYVMHQSANQAGSLAFSSVLAMFPLLILMSASAGFIGQPGEAAALANRVIGYAPQLVRDVLRPVIESVIEFVY